MDIKMKAAKRHYDMLMAELDKLGIGLEEFEGKLGVEEESEAEMPEMMEEVPEEGEEEASSDMDKAKIAIMLGKLKKKPKEEEY